MTTVLQYLVIAAVIALVLFGLALLLFGRGEQMPPLAARTSPASLPAQGIEGDDVRSVKFSLAVRGYRMSDVDWTLDRLAEELDRTRQRLKDLESVPPTASPATPLIVTEPTEPGGRPDTADGLTGSWPSQSFASTDSAQRVDDLFTGDPPPQHPHHQLQDAAAADQDHRS